MAKQVIKGHDGLKQVIDGINIVADAVRVTLGPIGRTVLLEKSYGAPNSSDDGVSIVKEIELKDPLHKMGGELLKEVATKTNDTAGDGTTTATVLTQAIATEGFKNIVAGSNPVFIKKGIEKAVEFVVEQLKHKSKKLTTKEEKAQVATISAKDEEVGNLIADLMEKVGPNGVITVEEGNTIGLSQEHVEGMKFDKGYISPYMMTDPERLEAVYKNPLILVTDKKISSIQSILPLLESLVHAGKKELVIIAEDVDGDALATLILNKLKGGFSTLAIKAPGFGDRRKDMLRDIAILTGARYITEELGDKLEDVKIDDLGSAEKVISDKENTTIIGGKGSKKDIKARIDEIKAQIEKTTSEYDKEKLNERLAKLSGGVAVIKVGAATEIEMKERKERIEDALNATRAALEEGIIPGGGALLAQIAKHIDDSKEDNVEVKIGMQIVKRALTYPLYYLAENAGYKGDVVVDKVQNSKEGIGFNALTGEYVDMVKEGIIDPVKVERLALQNAASIATMLLSTEAIVCELPEEKKNNLPSMPGGGYGDMM